jgi:HEAT repeat protein
LLQIAENKELDLETRSDAVLELGERREKAAVPRLVVILSSTNYDILTVHTICALGDIGDPEALPALEELRDREREYPMPGQIRTILEHAIASLKGHPVAH